MALPLRDLNMWCQRSQKYLLFLFTVLITGQPKPRQNEMSQPAGRGAKGLNVIRENPNSPTYDSREHVREVVVVRSQLTTGWVNIQTRAQIQKDRKKNKIGTLCSMKVGMHHSHGWHTRTHTHILTRIRTWAQTTLIPDGWVSSEPYDVPAGKMCLRFQKHNHASMPFQSIIHLKSN